MNITMVGRNMVMKEGKLWNVEIFEFYGGDGSEPMYSFFDAFKTKRQAINIAEVVRKDSYLRTRNKLMENPKYLA